MNKVYNVQYLKSEEEYMQELKEIHDELGIAIGTDTLIKSDLSLLTRADEIIVILSAIKKSKGDE